MLGLIERGSADFDAWLFAKEGGDGLVHALRIDFGDFRVLFLVAELAPNGDVKRSGHRNFPFQLCQSSFLNQS